MKACVFVIFQLCPWIVKVGDWALKWTEGNEIVQVFFVMLFFPVVMNALQYYIIDGFIKNHKPTDAEAAVNHEGADDDQRTQRPRARGDSETGRADEEDVMLPGETVASDMDDKPLPANGVTKLKISPKRLEEYDPITDGESNPALSEFRRRNSPSASQTTEGDERSARLSS